MAGDVLHDCAEADSRRAGLDGDRADNLHSGLGILRARHLDLTGLPFRNLSEGEGPVIDDVGVPHPVLLVIIAFGKQPDFVTTIVEPLIARGRKVFAGKFRIIEEVRVARERNLYQPSAVLRYEHQLHPFVRDLLRVPALVFDWLHATLITFYCIARCGSAPGERTNGTENEPDRQSGRSGATRKL